MYKKLKYIIPYQLIIFTLFYLYNKTIFKTLLWMSYFYIMLFGIISIILICTSSYKEHN